MAEFESIFAKFDENKDGKFSKDEFGKICYALGHFLSPAELDAAFLLIDADGSGFIEKDEFIRFWRSDDRFKRLRLNPDQMAKLQNLVEFFQYFDDDGNGSLSHDEFEAMVAHMVSTGIDLKKFNFTVQSIDKNNDGQIKGTPFFSLVYKLCTREDCRGSL